MKVLSIQEPYASLIAQHQKLIETRSWKTTYRGELYIHASLKKINEQDKITQELLELLPDRTMKYGYIILKCQLVDCIYMDEAFLNEIKKHPKEWICGQYELGRYAWVLEHVEVLDTPIPAKGKLSIWNFSK